MAICWISSYPKSGNTWFRAFLTNYLLDYPAPANINDLIGRIWASDRRWLDSLLGFDSSLLSFEELDAVRPQLYAWAGRPNDIRYYKVHDRYRRTTDGTPVFPALGAYGCLYIVRNPLDVVTSYAHHLNTSIDSAIDVITDSDHRIQGKPGKYNRHIPQFIGSWSDNVSSWMFNGQIATHVVRFEDMLSKPVQTFRAALCFLGLEVDASRLKKAIQFSKFGEMQRQEEAGRYFEKPAEMVRFFRQGLSGNWKQALTAAQIDRVTESHEDVMRCLSYL
jgi:hypothetical protein